MSVKDVFRTDLALLHAPSVYDFRTSVIMHEMSPELRDTALTAIRLRVGEANEASLCATDELKWGGARVGHLALRPGLAGRLGLALGAEAGHGWHRLTGAYDTAIFSGRRLPPVEAATGGVASEAVLLGMPQRPVEPIR